MSWKSLKEVIEEGLQRNTRSEGVQVCLGLGNKLYIFLVVQACQEGIEEAPDKSACEATA